MLLGVRIYKNSDAAIHNIHFPPLTFLWFVYPWNACEHIIANNNGSIVTIRNTFPGPPGVTAPSYTLNGNIIDYQCDSYGGSVVIFGAI